MNLDPISTTEEENYVNYDNRPIRPMDQEALNEALARLPILIDEDETNVPLDPTTRSVISFSLSLTSFFIVSSLSFSV